MSGKKAMGANPLDALMGGNTKAAKKASRKGLGKVKAVPKKAEAESPKKVRATFHLPEDLIAQARNTVVALSGPPHRLTLAALMESAIRKELATLEKKHNKGKPFPAFKGELKGGRPIGS